MKVICIDDIGEDGIKLLINVGEVYTTYEYQGRSDCYRLLEIPKYMDIPVCYKKYHFIPLSSIDETEFERNYKTELV